MKNTVSTFKEQKVKGDKITMLTAYDYSTAKLMDRSAGCRQALDRDIYRSGSSGNERANPGCH